MRPYEATELLFVPYCGVDVDATALDTPVSSRMVYNCSGATTLDVLAPHDAFGLHPLMTVAPGASPAVLRGAGCAIAGTTPRALAAAGELALRLGMRATEVAERDRPAYHAAAAIASNFLTTIEGAAERLAATAGVERELLVPLVRASVDNWAELGARRAMTGPIARGDAATVARHRAALAERAPDLVPLYDALAEATQRVVGAPA